MNNKDQAASVEPLSDSGSDVDSLIGRLDRLWAQGTSSPLADGVRRLGKYRLLSIVGAGSFGVVYLARDTVFERAVALKLPRLEVLQDAGKRRRFAAEAALTVTLDHPGIVRVYEACLDGPQPYIVSAFCDGPNLAEWLSSRNEQPTWQTVVRLVADVVDGVEYAHSRGVLHRDLKPANILLESNESAADGLAKDSLNDLASFTARLTDFGLAKFSDLETADTRSSQMIGTPLYMAPERLEGSEATVATDVYSLGVILFESLTGRPPIDGDHYLDLVSKIKRQAPGRLHAFRSDVPADLDRIVAKCLQKEPKARYGSAADLANDLRRCAAGQPIQGRLPTWGNRLASWCTRPERVANAGWFAVVSHLVLIAWVVCAVMLLPLQFEFGEVQWSRQVQQMLYAVCFSLGPIVLLGWFVLRHYRLAIYIGFLITLGKIPGQFRAMVLKPIYLADLYETGGVYVFMDHFMVAVLLLFQLFFFGCAVAADLKQRRRTW